MPVLPNIYSRSRMHVMVISIGMSESARKVYSIEIKLSVISVSIKRKVIGQTER